MEFSAVFWGMVHRGLRLSVTNVEYKMEAHLSHLEGVWAVNMFLQEVRRFGYLLDQPEIRKLENAS
jgi:hypothetical protein